MADSYLQDDVSMSVSIIGPNPIELSSAGAMGHALHSVWWGHLWWPPDG